MPSNGVIARAGILLLLGAPTLFFTAPAGEGLFRMGALVAGVALLFWLEHRFSP